MYRARERDAAGVSSDAIAHTSYDASSLPPDLLDLVHHTEEELRRLYRAARPRRVTATTHTRHPSRPGRDRPRETVVDESGSAASEDSRDAYSALPTSRRARAPRPRSTTAACRPRVATRARRTPNTSASNGPVAAGATTRRHTPPVSTATRVERPWVSALRDLLPDAASSSPARTEAAKTARPRSRHDDDVTDVESDWTGSSDVAVSGERTFLHPTAAEPSATAADVAGSSSTAKKSGTVAPLPRSSVVHYDLVEALRKELDEHKTTLRELRGRHAKELATLREANAQVRVDTARETTEQLRAAYAVKQDVLQTALDAERRRVAEGEERLRTLRQEQRVLQKRHDTLTTAMTTQEAVLRRREVELRAMQDKVSQLQDELAAQTEARLRHAVDAKRSKEQVTTCQDKEAELTARVQELQTRLTEQEHTAKETLRQLEEEFARTTDSYQSLLTAATERAHRLQGLQRKYRQLKDTHTALSQEKDQLLASHQVELARQHEETAKLRTELDALRARLSEVETRAQDEASASLAAREELTRQLELHRDTARAQQEVWEERLRTANHTVQQLRAQLTGSQQEATEEQAHAETLALQIAEREARLQRELGEQRRVAAAYKVRSEDTIASLKRQLREKDAKLQAMVATAAEPLQRVRSQLAEERTRRTALEAQLRDYKQKAKDAEDRALREMRREQLRANPRTALQPRENDARVTVTSPRAAPVTATVRSPAKSTVGRSWSARAPPRQLTTTEQSPPRVHTTAVAHSAPRVAPPAAAEVPPESSENELPSSLDRVALTPIPSASSASAASLASAMRPSAGAAESDEAVSVRQWRGVYQQCGNEQEGNEGHEQRLRDFHANAAEVFRKITDRREEFLAQCASIIRNSAAHARPGGVSPAASNAVDGHSVTASSNQT